MQNYSGIGSNVHIAFRHHDMTLHVCEACCNLCLCKAAFTLETPGIPLNLNSPMAQTSTGIFFMGKGLPLLRIGVHTRLAFVPASNDSNNNNNNNNNAFQLMMS